MHPEGCCLEAPVTLKPVMPKSSKSSCLPLLDVDPSNGDLPGPTQNFQNTLNTPPSATTLEAQHALRSQRLKPQTPSLLNPQRLDKGANTTPSKSCKSSLASANPITLAGLPLGHSLTTTTPPTWGSNWPLLVAEAPEPAYLNSVLTRLGPYFGLRSTYHILPPPSMPGEKPKIRWA